MSEPQPPELPPASPAPAPAAPAAPYPYDPAYAYTAPYAAAVPNYGLPQPPLRAVSPLGWIYGLGVLLAGGVAAHLLDQLYNYVTSLIQVAPFGALGLLGYVGRRHLWARVLGYLLLAVLLSLVFVVITLFAVGALLGGSSAGPGRSSLGGFNSQNMVQVGAVMLWCAVAAFSALLLIAPPVRAAISARLDTDVDDPVHTLALAMILPATLVSFGQLIATNGRPMLLTIMTKNPDLLGEMTGADLAVSMGLGLVFSIPAVCMAVGWPYVRSWGEALERVGIVRIGFKQVVIAIGLAIAMVAVFQGLDYLLTAIWEWTKWPKTDVQAFEKLMKPLITPGGAVLIGITAGLGEEIAVRGALQPRLGILLSNLFFTSLHALQYGFDGLISVFCAGLVLGLIRRRTNTSTSAITHGVYDFILVSASWYFGQAR